MLSVGVHEGVCVCVCVGVFVGVRVTEAVVVAVTVGVCEGVAELVVLRRTGRGRVRGQGVAQVEMLKVRLQRRHPSSALTRSSASATG
jgi:hypothetical protein